MQGKKDYQEKLFIRFQLSDYVPQDNFYRQLKGLLDFSYLYQSTVKYYGKEGQKSIDPVVFMKLMLVGYLENLNSDRRIITTSRMRMDILYFIGYDLDEELPWHSTLSRTRQLYGEEQFISIFKQILTQCVDKGLVSGKRQAVDSVFVKANASMEALVKREILLDASAYTKELNTNIKEEIIDPAPAFKELPPDGKKPKKKLTKGTNKTHVSPTDPDSRMSVKPGKATKLNYLGQVCVDTENHVITHIQAFRADKADSQCLKEVLINTIENLKDNSLEIKEVLADGGYSSATALQALENIEVVGYIPNAPGYIAQREGFTYDNKNDRYICSQGKYLPFKKFRTDSGNTYKLYKTSVKDCRECPLKERCANPAGYKTMEDSISKELFNQMHLRMQTRKAKKMKHLRSSTVEPVIGSLVNFNAMSKVNTKGIKLANKCMIMAAVAYNIKKLVKANAVKLKKNAAVAIKVHEYNVNSYWHDLNTFMKDILRINGVFWS
ncbi:IS1182 family transposase [Pedobacter hiemivivus]|uniref:IS1182 family transposase n=3 Tax=Pedobacter hiemivivus TaxID=2530454 RepID=A0A4R0M6T3_9SPHI|nr:IS1182 family transposase [Pedobacter hiemivivus]TCC81697.1 IS1182 family transposase [Pedobacter hiemivivus]